MRFFLKTSGQESKLIQLIESTPLAGYPRHSRAHPLKGFPGRCFVKRDDELSFGVAGSKMRKYLSLVPLLKSNGIENAVLIGGASSNNLVGLSQLLIEEGIQPVLFLCGRKPERPSGNLLISQLLVDQKHILWHGKESWPVINRLAEEYAKNLKAGCVIPEGASCPAALPGALTLAQDILENERELGISFDHLVCDAGTGMMASALILANSLLGKNVHHHVLLLAEDEKAFLAKLATWRNELEMLAGKKIDTLAPIRAFKPSNAQAFGSVNAGVKSEIARLAREEGILSDPIYSAKLFAETRKLSLDGNVLLIHSGCALGSMGTY